MCRYVMQAEPGRRTIRVVTQNVFTSNYYIYFTRLCVLLSGLRLGKISFKVVLANASAVEQCRLCINTLRSHQTGPPSRSLDIISPWPVRRNNAILSSELPRSLWNLKYFQGRLQLRSQVLLRQPLLPFQLPKPTSVHSWPFSSLSSHCHVGIYKIDRRSHHRERELMNEQHKQQPTSRLGHHWRAEQGRDHTVASYLSQHRAGGSRRGF